MNSKSETDPERNHMEEYLEESFIRKVEAVFLLLFLPPVIPACNSTAHYHTSAPAREHGS